MKILIIPRVNPAIQLWIYKFSFPFPWQ